MSPQMRALIIGMLGPSLQAVGGLWDLLEHGVFAPVGGEKITLTHILSGPAHLFIFTGFMLSVLCIPIAIEVARSRPEDLEAPPYEPDNDLSTAEPRPAYGFERMGNLR